MSRLEQFYQVASDDDRAAVAEHAKTTPDYLLYIARGYRKSAINVRMAVRIEEYTKRLSLANPVLPIVTCQDLAAD